MAAPAFAQDADPYIALPAKEAARLIARDAELDAVRAQVAALEAVVAAQAKHIDAQAKVITLQDEEIKRRERITALADEERDVHKDRAERIAKDAAGREVSLNIQAKAGLFALACAPFSPAAGPFAPAVPVLCAGVGALYGWLGPR